MVHNSKQLFRNLDVFIARFSTVVTGSVRISDAKRDGTVFVRFRSTEVEPAEDPARRFKAALDGLASVGVTYEQPTPVQFRVALSHFEYV